MGLHCTFLFERGQKLADYCKAETGAGEEDRYAYKFELRLPLKQPMQIK